MVCPYCKTKTNESKCPNCKAKMPVKKVSAETEGKTKLFKKERK